MKILISWIAINNDFIRDKGLLKGTNHDGPNFNMHKYYYMHDKHIILCANNRDLNGAERLQNDIVRAHPDHSIEVRNMQVNDVIDIAEIKQKAEALLLEYGGNTIDIFASPGTPAMTVAWFICHTSLPLDTKLVQLRPASKSKTGKPELLELNIKKSETPYSAVIKENIAEQLTGKDRNYLITNSIKPIYDKAELIAQTDKVTVLINGETGTGKEHLASYIHKNSIRKKKPYLSINCSAFSDQLLESRLFGYCKGSFTGADKDTKGIFESAEGGTIFLDEIGDISPYMQQSLLRVLQEGEIMPLGGKSKKVNARVISATNKDLAKLCQEGKFRWDLYYRLVVTELELPDLLERGPEEIEKMIDHFIKTKKKDLKKPKPLRFTRDARQFLRNYPWPGNIRELENLIETLYVYCTNEVTVDDIPARFKKIPEDESLNWEDIEKKHIEMVLRLKKGNQRQAWLAIGYKALNTLRNKIDEYGIDIELYK